MKMTAELSLYPLQDEPVAVIQAFIAAARKYQGLEIVTNAMSTQVCGDYDAVLALVSEERARSYQQYGKQVLVCKFIPWELDLG